MSKATFTKNYLSLYKEQPWDIRKTYDYVFHAKARTRVTDLLRAVAERGDIDPKLSIGYCRRHDAIFVNGGRGVGKTVFLTQADKFLGEDKKLQFLPVLEPSLLDGTVSSPERFISAVVAQVNELVETRNLCSGDRDGKDCQLDDYGRAYRDVAEAVSGVQSFTKGDGNGADDLFSMQSVISLERALHKFFGFACGFLDVKALILRLDDVDMACGIGFCVLEAIRKYLASPYVVPMVSGDLDLYQRLCENHFRETLKSKEEAKDSDLERKVKCLAESYLQKVLPADRRVDLHALGYGMASGEIQIDDVRLAENLKDEGVAMAWADVKACLDFYAFGAMKNEHYRRESLPDSVEHKECFRGAENLSIPLELPSTRAAFMFLSRIFDVLKAWNKDGESSFSWERFRIFHAAARDVTEHVKAFEARQEAARVNALASAGGTLSIVKIFRNLDFEKLGFDEAMREGAEEKKTPSISKRSISDSGFGEDVVGQLCPFDRFLWNMFVQEDYYSKANTNTNLVFGGRFFEYVFSSFDSDIDFLQMLSRVPFGAVLKDALKKKAQAVDSVNSKEEEGDDDDDGDSSTTTDKNEETKGFSYPVGNGLLRIDSYFLGEVAKRYFANLSKARSKILRSKNGEALFPFMRRCAYILLNAVAGVEQEEVEYTPYDVAIKRAGAFSDIESFDSAWKKNISPMLKKEGSVTKKIFDHPLVSLLIKNETMRQLASQGTEKRNKSELKVALCAFDEIDINGRPSKAEVDTLFDHYASSWTVLSDFEKTYEENRMQKGFKSLSVSSTAKSPSREAAWRRRFRELYNSASNAEKNVFNDKYPNFVKEK